MNNADRTNLPSVLSVISVVNPPLRFVEEGEGVPQLASRNRNRRCLAVARLVIRPVHDGLVAEHVAVADLEVIVAVGAAADPRLVVNRSALTSEVRQGEQHALSTL